MGGAARRRSTYVYSADAHCRTIGCPIGARRSHCQAQGCLPCARSLNIEAANLDGHSRSSSQHRGGDDLILSRCVRHSSSALGRVNTHTLSSVIVLVYRQDSISESISDSDVFPSEARGRAREATLANSGRHQRSLTDAAACERKSEPCNANSSSSTTFHVWERLFGE